MTYTDKKLEKYFNSLGYTLFEIKGSVYREEKSTFVFQTDNKYHTVDCSTILYDHAVKIYQALAEEREREEIVIRPKTKIKSFPISFEWDGKQIDCIETYYIDTKNTTAFDWSLGTFEDELIEDTSEYSLGLNFFTAELCYEEYDSGDYATGQPPSGGHSVNLVRDTDLLSSIDKLTDKE